MAKRNGNVNLKQGKLHNDALSEGIRRLINSVDRRFPAAFTPGLSVHTFLELKLQDTTCFKTAEHRAAENKCARLSFEIQDALPADKKQLDFELDTAIGVRLCVEELIPLTAGLIAGLRLAGTPVEETVRIVRGHLRNVVPVQPERHDSESTVTTPAGVTLH